MSRRARAIALTTAVSVLALAAPAYAQTPNINLMPEFQSKSPEEKEADAIKEKAYKDSLRKIPDAKAQFEQAVNLDPHLADARYWLGMALVNAGTPEAMKEAKPHFEAYIKLAPTGANVETATPAMARERGFLGMGLTTLLRKSTYLTS